MWSLLGLTLWWSKKCGEGNHLIVSSMWSSHFYSEGFCRLFLLSVQCLSAVWSVVFLLELSFGPHLIQYTISKPWQSLGSNIHCILYEGQRGHSCFHNNKLYFEQTWYFKSKDIHYLPDGANFSLQYFRGWVAFSSIT